MDPGLRSLNYERYSSNKKLTWYSVRSNTLYHKVVKGICRCAQMRLMGLSFWTNDQCARRRT